MGMCSRGRAQLLARFSPPVTTTSWLQVGYGLSACNTQHRDTMDPLLLLLSLAVTRDGAARDALVQSKQRRYSAPHCSEALLARSYTLPPRWPWGAFHLVMEFTPNTCDFYAEGATSFCSGMAALNPPPADPETQRAM